MAEHHLNASQIPKERDWMQSKGWRSTWNPARSSGRSKKGTSGGVAIASKSQLHLAPFQGGKGKEDRHEERGDDWIAVVVRLKGLDVLLITAYLTCGIGMSGANISKRAQIMRFILKHDMPYIIVADWQVQPDVLKGSNFGSE